MFLVFLLFLMTVVIIKVNVNKLKVDHLIFNCFTDNKVQILCVLFTSEVGVRS